MENKRPGFAFGSKEYTQKPPFLISIKKTYTEEYNFVPNYDHWNTFMQKKTKSSFTTSGRVNNGAALGASQFGTESELSCEVPELSSNPTDIITHNVNMQLVDFQHRAQDSKLPKLSMVFPDTFDCDVGLVATKGHLNMPSTPTPGSYQLCQIQTAQNLATTTNKSNTDISCFDTLNSVHTMNQVYEKSCQEVPILGFTSKEPSCNTSISAELDIVKRINFSCNSLDKLSSTNNACVNTLPIVKDQYPIILRKLLNLNSKRPSPWPEMPRNVDVTPDSQEFKILHKMKSPNTPANHRSEDYGCSNIEFQNDENKLLVFEESSEESLKISKYSDDVTMSLKTKDFFLNSVGSITTESAMGLSFTYDHSEEMNTMLSPSEWINGSDFNPLQIPWPEIMKEITYDDDNDVRRQWTVPEKYDIRQISDKEQIVPHGFVKTFQNAIQKEIFEENVDDLEFNHYPEFIQEVVLTSDIPKYETEDVTLTPVNNELLSCLEHHNYSCKIDEDAIVPLSSSPWFEHQFNMSMVELDVCCSPINASLWKVEKSIEDALKLKNENELDGGHLIEEFKVNGAEPKENAVAKEDSEPEEDPGEDAEEEAVVDNVYLGIGKDEEDPQIYFGEVQLESIPDPMNAESVTVDEQTVPNLHTSMKSVPSSSAFMHTFEFEDFYLNSTLKKRVKGPRVDGSNYRPLRLGLSKKRRVNPLHMLNTSRKE